MYKNNGWWFTSIQIDGKRLFESLKTKDKKTAKSREPRVRNRLYHSIISNSYDKRLDILPNNQLVNIFLKTKKNRSTKRTYYYILHQWLKNKPLPVNVNTENSYKKHLNAFFNWCNANYKTDFSIYSIKEIQGRTRVYTKEEMDKILNNTDKCRLDGDFIKLAYYTGARRGELLNITAIHSGYMEVDGKNGKRMVKINSQAEKIKIKPYNYTEDYVTKEFKVYLRKLGIKNGQFHDIRRTFGLNLIMQGIPVYKVSKLLGHSSIRTTEKHYAPLLVTKIEDFEL